MNTWITKHGVTYDFYKITEESEVKNGLSSNKESNRKQSKRGQIVKINLENANSKQKAKGLKRQQGVFNFMTGSDKSKWVQEAPIYKEVFIANTLNGISTRYYYDEGNIRYDYILDPNTNPNDISMKVEGSNRNRINANGDLVFTTQFGEVSHSKLFAYQEIEGQKKQVKCSFEEKRNGSFGFKLGDYDRTLPLTIDPILYATYLGADLYDATACVRIQGGGGIAVLGGSTLSFGTFPISTGSYNCTTCGFVDIFITKISTGVAGSGALLYSTVVGGWEEDNIFDLQVDAAGNIYWVGNTISNDYPQVNGIPNSNPFTALSFDAIFTKLNTNGFTIDYSIMIGVDAEDENAFSLQLNGPFAYIGGTTTWANFPIAGPYAVSNAGLRDGFLTVIDYNLTGAASVVFSTCIGGTDNDEVKDLTIANSNDLIYLTGYTNSINFPTMGNSYDATHNGGEDAFLVAYTISSTNTNTLAYSSFFGSAANERGECVAVNTQGQPYFAGNAHNGLPTTANAYKLTNVTSPQTLDGFVACIDPTLVVNSLIYSTYIGAGLYDGIEDIAINACDNILISGTTLIDNTNPANNFPTNSTIAPDFASPVFSPTNTSDVFFSVLRPKPLSTELVYSTFLGGENIDDYSSLDVSWDGDFYITGRTYSTAFQPVTTGVAAVQPPYQPNMASGSTTDAFLVRLLGPKPSGMSIVSSVVHNFSCPNTPVTLSIINPNPLATYTWQFNTTPSTGTSVVVSPSATTTYTVTESYFGCDHPATITITIKPELCCGPVASGLVTNPSTIIMDHENSSTLISQMGSSITPAGSNIVINGTFTIDQNINFSNCNVYFTANADVNLNSSRKIEGNNAIFMSLPDATCPMWNRIFANNSNNEVKMTDCTVEDVINGIRLVNGAKGLFTHNTFNNNSVALWFQLTPLGNGDIVWGNTFTSTALKQPYLGAKGAFGVFAFDARGLTIGNPWGASNNTFSNIECGISCINQFGNGINNYGLNSYFNQFTNIVGGVQLSDIFTNQYTSFYTTGKGCGILINGASPNHWSNLNSFGDTYDNVNKAVVTKFVRANINNCIVNDADCGFMNSSTDGLNYNITKNTLKNVHYGMQFVGNSGNYSRVENNTITLNPSYITYSQPIGIFNPNGGLVSYVYQPTASWPVGIDMKYLSNTVSSPFTIGGSNANPNEPAYSNIIEITGRGGIGVQINNAGRSLDVRDNKIKMTTTEASACAPNQIHGACGSATGIYTANSMGSIFQGNHIIGTQASNSVGFNNRLKRGVYIDNSKDLIFKCNTVQRTHYGIEAWGSCQTAAENVRGNLFNNHKLAMLFRSYNGNPGGFGNNIGNSASTTYKDNNNLFNGSYYNYYGNLTKVLRLTFASDNTTNRRIYINPVNPNASNVGNILNSESKSNIAGAAYQIQNFNYSLFTDCAAPESLLESEVSDGGLTSDEALSIIQGNNQYPLFSAVSQYMDRAYLYRLLDENIALRNSDIEYNEFYDDESVENLGRMQGIDNLLGLLGDSTVQDSVIYDSLILAIAGRNNTLSDEGNSYENCERWINDRLLQIQTQGEATLTADEKLNIALLANSCPVSVGNCVFKARTLNTLLQPGAQYQDELLCSAAMPQNKNGLNLFEEEEKILANGIPSGDVLQGDHEMIIYPNPNKAYGKLSVKYKLLSTNPATLTINTMAGQTLRNIAVNLDLQSTILDLENIAQGIYQVSLQQEGSPTLTRKLVIGD